MLGSRCILQQLPRLACLGKTKDTFCYNIFPVVVAPRTECCWKAIQFSGKTLVQRIGYFSKNVRYFSSFFTLKGVFENAGQ